MKKAMKKAKGKVQGRLASIAKKSASGKGKGGPKAEASQAQSLQEEKDAPSDNPAAPPAIDVQAAKPDSKKVRNFPGRSAAVREVAKLDYKSAKYGKLYYKNSNIIGIRRKFGDCHQVFSFGGKRSCAGEGVLRAFGEDVLRKLGAGQSEKEVAA